VGCADASDHYREPRALEAIAAAAIPGLVDQAIETAHCMASDPLDWVY
jgi:hypothetical protein